jgi:hypothetical protein
MPTDRNKKRKNLHRNDWEDQWDEALSNPQFRQSAWEYIDEVVYSRRAKFLSLFISQYSGHPIEAHDSENERDDENEGQSEMDGLEYPFKIGEMEAILNEDDGGSGASRAVNRFRDVSKLLYRKGESSNTNEVITTPLFEYIADDLINVLEKAEKITRVLQPVHEHPEELIKLSEEDLANVFDNWEFWKSHDWESDPFKPCFKLLDFQELGGFRLPHNYVETNSNIESSSVSDDIIDVDSLGQELFLREIENADVVKRVTNFFNPIELTNSRTSISKEIKNSNMKNATVIFAREDAASFYENIIKPNIEGIEPVELIGGSVSEEANISFDEDPLKEHIGMEISLQETYDLPSVEMRIQSSNEGGLRPPFSLTLFGTNTTEDNVNYQTSCIEINQFTYSDITSSEFENANLSELESTSKLMFEDLNYTEASSNETPPWSVRYFNYYRQNSQEVNSFEAAMKFMFAQLEMGG